MNLTPESLAVLRESADMLAAVCDRAAKCDHLEARNKHLQESNDGISARHGQLQAVIRKAREGLAGVLPECREMSLPELVVEAAGRIQNLRHAASSFTATAPKIEIDALVRENRRLAAEVESLICRKGELEDQCAEFEDKVREGDRFVLEEHVASWTRLRQHLLDSDAGESLVGRIEGVMLERNRLRAENQEQWQRADYAEKHLGELAKFVGKVGENWAGVVSEAMSSIEHANMVIDRVSSRLAEARAENGRQAATIAAMTVRHEAIFWNSHNGAVQDHRDGTIIQPDTDKERAKRGLPPFTPDPGPQSLLDRIRHAINCTAAENGSDTPDFILADYLMAALDAFDAAVRVREEWYGRKTSAPIVPTIDPASPHP